MKTTAILAALVLSVPLLSGCATLGAGADAACTAARAIVKGCDRPDPPSQSSACATARGIVALCDRMPDTVGDWSETLYTSIVFTPDPPGTGWAVCAGDVCGPTMPKDAALAAADWAREFSGKPWVVRRIE